MFAPGAPVSGFADLRYGDAGSFRGGSVGVNASVGRFVLQLGATKRETGELLAPPEEGVAAVEERDKARDAIFGFSGTLSQFSVALGSLAAEAIGGVWGDLLGLLGSAAGLAQQNDLDNASQAVLDIADTNLAFTPAEIAGVRNAVRKADTYLAQTGDDQGALRVYSGELGRSDAARAKGQGVVKGLSIAVSIADYTAKTNGLADSIQKFGDYRREANSNKTNMDDVQNRMADKQAEIDEARQALDGPCPGIPSTSNVPRRNSLAEPRSPYRLVQSTANATSEPTATAEDVRSAVAGLSGVDAKLARAMPWLLPFFARETNGISPKLLAALLRRAEPDLRAVAVDVEKATRAGRELERTMGGSVNPPVARMPERGAGASPSPMDPAQTTTSKPRGGAVATITN